MSNPSKQKGTAAETGLTYWLRLNGFPQAERRALSGNQDKGDILVCPGIIAEVKHHREWGEWDIPPWLAETDRETHHAGADHGVLIVRRHRTPYAGNWWAYTPCAHGDHILRTTVECWALALRRLGYGNPL